MGRGKGFALRGRQCSGNGNGVLDLQVTHESKVGLRGQTTYLPTIERNTGKALHILCANLRQTLTVIDTLQEASDDGLSRLFLKFVITHDQMNPIENGIIELVYQIGGQEHYAIVVL